MKYKVRVYTLQNNNEILLGKIIVDRTETGIYETITKHKIHISSGAIKLAHYNDRYGLFNLYVKNDDLNRNNIIFTQKSKQIKIPTSKVYQLKKYEKEHEELLELIKDCK